MLTAMRLFWPICTSNRCLRIWRSASIVPKPGKCIHWTLKSQMRLLLNGTINHRHCVSILQRVYLNDGTYFQISCRIFLVDLLNFSFWSERDPDDKSVPHPARYAVEYEGVRYTGYWALCACINRGELVIIFLWELWLGPKLNFWSSHTRRLSDSEGAMVGKGCNRARAAACI